MAKLNSGDVPITLAGHERILKPTLRAITMISAQYGGLSKARAALAEQDFQAVSTVIKWGLNLTDKETRQLPEQIFQTGLTAELIVPLINYLGILSNGGKPLPDDPVERDESAEGNEP